MRSPSFCKPASVWLGPLNISAAVIPGSPYLRLLDKCSQLYWTDEGNGTINMTSLSGSPSPRPIVTGQNIPQLIAVPPA